MAASVGILVWKSPQECWLVSPGPWRVRPRLAAASGYSGFHEQLFNDKSHSSTPIVGPELPRAGPRSLGMKK
jgi:hypothetical protein